MAKREPLLKRILSKINIDENNCWNYMGAKQSDGYGCVSKTIIGKKYNYTTHRFIYRAFVGRIKNGYEIDHLCRNRACCNPMHLEAVTHKENVKRGMLVFATKERQNKKTHCPYGHKYTTENTRVRITKTGTSRCCITCDKIGRKNIPQRESGNRSKAVKQKTLI